MLELFAGSAVLCSVAKQQGLYNSIAVDKTQKHGCFSSIIRLDLTREADSSLVDAWLDSGLLIWVHLAPVCGTASRARDIQVSANDPPPLRSNEHPNGFPDLAGRDLLRVNIANKLFSFACRIFAEATKRGILATMENPKNSYFWCTTYFLQLWKTVELYCADFQVCMYGGSRDKWTRFIANFPEVAELSVECDRKHSHAPWRFAHNPEGKRVWATSLESQYTRPLCLATVQVILQKAASQGLHLLPQTLNEIRKHPLLHAQQAQISVGLQPFRKKIPPLVPDFDAIVVAVLQDKSEVPVPVLGKAQNDLHLVSVELQLLLIPKYARLLRLFAASDSLKGGLEESETAGKSESGADLSLYPFRAVFGLPWEPEKFIEKAVTAGHPALTDMSIPEDLQIAIDRNLAWNDEQMSKYRSDWAKHWLMRAKELDAAESLDRSSRPEHVRHSTSSKRLLLTDEILDSIQYEDKAALNILREGSTLAGRIESCCIFEQQFKPCLMTLDQLEGGAKRRNQAILAMTCSCGDEALDQQVLAETRAELEKQWARGPFELDTLPEGAVISRRFPLVQSNKVRMIDDFSISGINDSCTIHSKIDLHMIDTLGAVIRRYFQACGAKECDSRLLAKTFDLKSAYRQVPIQSQHLKYAFFSIYNCEERKPEIYQLLALPFGATHSVYSFLRLARLIHSIAARGLYVLNTNFYDDFVLLSKPESCKSADLAMEVLFMLTGWEFARDGKKATLFETTCRALGVEFNLSRSERRIVQIYNTEQRRLDLVSRISEVLLAGQLSKHETLVLKGRLSFADSFLHGRLGKILLKKLLEHAYSRQRTLDESTKHALLAMKTRLEAGHPVQISDQELLQWFVYTDAAYNMEELTGGVGAVLVDQACSCIQWFGFPLNEEMCKTFGCQTKQSIIYELELVAAVHALSYWGDLLAGNLTTWFGDNDSVRYALIRGTAIGPCGEAIMKFHLEKEASENSLEQRLSPYFNMEKIWKVFQI